MTGAPGASGHPLLPNVIVLNGISSAGTSTLARAVQDRLARPYLVLGVDTLVDAMPPASSATEEGLIFHADGRVETGAGFTSLENAWYAGLAAIAARGVGLILDEVLLGGVRSQGRLSAALEGLHVLWVAVDCDVQVASAREATRADRTPGMAAAQAPLVHVGVRYDLRVDTTVHSPAACAEQVLAAIT